MLYTRNAESNDNTGLTIVLISLAAVLVFILNAGITKMLDKYFPWEKFLIKRFAAQLFLGLICSLLVINVLYKILKDIYTDAAPDMGQTILISLYGAAVVVPVISVYFGIKFLRSWNATLLQSERLEKEKTRSQMMSLRNHLDPHFLFNNLNVLSALIDHDVELSKTYLDKFAEVYRTILKSELSDLTLLSDELKLMEAYLYLVKIRFNDGLQIVQSIRQEDLDKALPPLAAQMLLENVIKHNAISKSKPVTISIHTDGKYLSIKNNKVIKKYQENTKSGTGLLNIQNRYQYFSDKNVTIHDTDAHFEVQLPLLEIE